MRTSSVLDPHNKTKPRLLDAPTKKNEIVVETIDSDNSDLEVIGQKGKPIGADFYRYLIA